MSVRCTTKYVALLLLTALSIPHPTASASESTSNGLLCDWVEDDIIYDDYAHSSSEFVPPPIWGDDWTVGAHGQYTHSHSAWVYTKISEETGAQHILINGG